MNEKIKRLIDKVESTLDLDKSTAEYLANIIDMAYVIGTRDGLKEGRDIALRAIRGEKQKGSE